MGTAVNREPSAEDLRTDQRRGCWQNNQTTFICFNRITNMPGHLKKSEGPDPDPSEFLFVSREDKMKDMAKPYDAKLDCWVNDPDPATGFSLGTISKEEEEEEEEDEEEEEEEDED